MKCFSSFLRIPQDWTHVGRVDPTEELELTFALKQRNVDLLEERLRLVSDPDSAQYGRAPSDSCRLSSSDPKYLRSKRFVKLRCSAGFVCPLLSSTGKHLTLEEVSSLVRPSELTQKVVRHWLQSHGITNCLTVRTGDFLQCTMTAG